MKLEFINQDAQKRTLSVVDRHTIRKVSRLVGAATRKAQGPAKRINTLQLPDFLVPQRQERQEIAKLGADSKRENRSRGYLQRHLETSAEISLSYSSPDVWDQRLSHDRSYLPNIPFPLPFLPNGRKIPNDLAIFTQPDLTASLLRRAAVADVNANPRRWVKICRLAQESVLQVLPQRYGYSRCLDDAIDSVTGRIQQYLGQDAENQLNHTRVKRAYGRALRSLQTALASSNSVDWTVWYATLLLALFEVRNGVTIFMLSTDCN